MAYCLGPHQFRDLLDEELFHSVDEQLLSVFPAGCTNCMTPESVCKFGDGYLCTQCFIYYTELHVCGCCGFAPIFPDICYHLTHYKPAAADIPVASDNPAHYADAIRYNARTPLQGSLLPLTRLVWA